VSSTVKRIDQCLYYVDKANKKFLLAKLLREPDVENALVFSRTKHGADRIVRELKREGIDACAIHGDKSQGQRQNALARFKSGESKVLIATDIAARGIDIAGLSHVFNYDMPMEPEAYVHRIGRTGRAGRDGKAISFCCIDETKQLDQVEKLIGKRLPVRESEWPMLVTTPTDPKEKEAARQLAKAARMAKLERSAALPKKVSASGNAVPEHKAHRAMPAAKAKAAETKPVKAAVREKAAESKQSRSAVRTAAPVQKPRFGPGAENRAAEPMIRASVPKGGQAIVIGKGGKVQPAAAKPAQSKPGRAPLAKPVQRVNRTRGRNGER